MTKPSKAGVVAVSLFGLPFLGMGLFAAYTFLNAPNQPLAARIGGAVFASVFALIGGGLIFGSLYGYSLQKEKARQAAANPASPWLWRQDWAARRVEGKNKSSVIGWWVAAVLANMLFLPLSLGTISKGLSTQDPKYISRPHLGWWASWCFSVPFAQPSVLSALVKPISRWLRCHFRREAAWPAPSMFTSIRMSVAEST